MATLIGGMTTSLDGFMADDDASAERLHPGMNALGGTAHMPAMVKWITR
jgi:hypothetical protein